MQIIKLVLMVFSIWLVLLFVAVVSVFIYFLITNAKQIVKREKKARIIEEAERELEYGGKWLQ